eukprot:3781521-Rhodomonas_salina.6
MCLDRTLENRTQVWLRSKLLGHPLQRQRVLRCGRAHDLQVTAKVMMSILKRCAVAADGAEDERFVLLDRGVGELQRLAAAGERA